MAARDAASGYWRDDRPDWEELCYLDYLGEWKNTALFPDRRHGVCTRVHACVYHANLRPLSRNLRTNERTFLLLLLLLFRILYRPIYSLFGSLVYRVLDEFHFLNDIAEKIPRMKINSEKFLDNHSWRSLVERSYATNHLVAFRSVRLKFIFLENNFTLGDRIVEEWEHYFLCYEFLFTVKTGINPVLKIEIFSS